MRRSQSASGVNSTGCKLSRAGIGTSAGRSVEGADKARSYFFFLAALATLPEFSSTPPSIHLRSVSIISSAIFGDSGGIAGSSSCVTSLYR